MEFCTKILAAALARSAVLVLALASAAALAQGAGKADGPRGVASMGDAATGARKAALCLGCHRIERPAPFIPALQGQPYEYLSGQMRALQKRDRRNPGMHLALATLSMTDVRDIARYFSGEAPLRSRHTTDPARVAAGKSRAAGMQCASCHGETYSGGGRMARIAGQHPDYIAIQLEATRSGKRTHPEVPGMRTLADAEIDELAQFIGSLK